MLTIVCAQQSALLHKRSNSLTQHDYRNHQRGILTDTRQAKTQIGHDTPEPVKVWSNGTTYEGSNSRTIPVDKHHQYPSNETGSVSHMPERYTQRLTTTRNP